MNYPLISEDATAFISAAVYGWELSSAGKIDQARQAYLKADRLLSEGSLSPDLSILRHNVGKACGEVIPYPPTEDRVVTIGLPETSFEEDGHLGMKRPLIDAAALEKNIRTVIGSFKPGHHRQNITKELPHTLVLSTGRCGTVSLYRLFEKGRIVPYHSYWWGFMPSTRWEMMCRIMAGKFDGDNTGMMWAATRAAEWLGAIGHDRPMIGLNHLDTIFAPVFAAIHPQAKFIHLHRDPTAVFESFFSKNQWSETQLRPMFYGFDPYFRFRRTGHDLPECIAWYIHFTDEFAKAMGRAVGPDRFVEISADRLFAQDPVEIDRLLDFTGTGISLDDAVVHFGTPINEKRHKATQTHDEMVGVRHDFTEAMARLQITGQL